VTGTLAVPTVLCYLGATPAGCGSALSLAAALAEGMKQALLHYQARENAQPEYAPPTVPAIPVHLRGNTGAYSAQQSLTASDLVERLREQGCCPVAVPLDHDPEVSAVLPYIVHVVLTHA
jgi:hypothetical protein